MIQPVVVIATHQRIAITMANIKTLHPYTVVLVVTDINEAELYRGLENVLVVIAPNDPLGAKWQAGIDFAKQIPHSHIVITGSDDILHKDYIRLNTSINIPFVGLREWYVWHNNLLHHLRYLAPGGMPLGGGRIYSRKLLESVDYKIFDPGRKKHLDDQGWRAATKASHVILLAPKILAYKGNWQVMNPLDLAHKNVKHISSYFGEEAKRILIEEFKIDPMINRNA